MSEYIFVTNIFEYSNIRIFEYIRTLCCRHLILAWRMHWWWATACPLLPNCLRASNLAVACRNCIVLARVHLYSTSNFQNTFLWIHYPPPCLLIFPYLHHPTPLIGFLVIHACACPLFFILVTKKRYWKLSISSSSNHKFIQGDFFHWYPPKKLKYGKPRLDESTLT